VNCHRVAGIQVAEITIVCIGKIADNFLRQANQWFVHSIHSTCFYCHDANENVICIGQQEIGKGPFILQGIRGSHWPGHLLPSIRSFIMFEDRLISDSGQLQFNLQGAETWATNLLDIRVAEHQLKEDLDWLVRQAREYAPPESLGRLIPIFLNAGGKMVPEEENALSAMLQKRILEVIAVIRQRHDIFDSFDITDNTNLLLSLIGLGNGLTPSGDDFLAGIVMGLHKVGNHRMASMLAARLLAAAKGKTTQVSLSFYHALAHDSLSESFYSFLDSIGNNLSSENERLLGDVTRFGATSGWDTVAGIAFILSLEQVPPATGKYVLKEAVC